MLPLAGIGDAPHCKLQQTEGIKTHLKCFSRQALPECSGRQVFVYIINLAVALGGEHLLQ